jgi:DNA-binding response OmpR family regulator
MGESILVVEDEAHVRELVSYTLQGAGYRVNVVADGESALREAASRDLDLIVLDIRLPGIDGWEVCRRVRERGNTPILFLTALADDEQLVKGLRLGADDYLPKPFSPAVLSARVQQCASYACADCPSTFPARTSADVVRPSISLLSSSGSCQPWPGASGRF